MRRGILAAATLPAFSLALVLMTAPFSVQAQEVPLPHLIQTVTERDIYEGMLELGLLETPVLEAEDCEEAYENVKDCVVRLNMGNAYGSGVVWKMTTEQIVIVTNKHVLEYWDEQLSYVFFPQGYFVEADILGVSEEYDVGFIVVDNRELGYEELEQIQYVHWDMAAYQKLQAGADIFCAGAEGITPEEEIEAFYQGRVGDMWQYIDEFEEYMIYAYGHARPGMSGGGTFDARGNFIGMISGGTKEDETASVPLPVILEAYEDIG